MSASVARRHLTESQRAMAAAKLAKLPRGANQHAQICAPSQDEAAEKLNVSRPVALVLKSRTRSPPELVETVESGALSVLFAVRAAGLPEEDEPRL